MIAQSIKPKFNSATNPHSTHFLLISLTYIYIYIYRSTLALHALKRSLLDKNHKNPLRCVIANITKYLKVNSRGLDTSLHFVSLSMTKWGALIRTYDIAIHNLVDSRVLDCYVSATHFLAMTGYGGFTFDSWIASGFLQKPSQ